MNNEKGLTIFHVIFFVVIAGLSLYFIISTISNIVLKNKKDKMIEDAKLFVEKTKKYIESGKGSYPGKTYSVTYDLSQIDTNNEIIDSPFKSVYDRDYILSEPYTSYIRISNINNDYKFDICLTDNKYTLNIISDSNEDISVLNSKEKYKKINKHVLGDCEILR